MTRRVIPTLDHYQARCTNETILRLSYAAIASGFGIIFNDMAVDGVAFLPQCELLCSHYLKRSINPQLTTKQTLARMMSSLELIVRFVVELLIET